MRLAATILALCALLANEASAERAKTPESSIVQRILKRLETDNRECSVSLDFAGRITNGDQNEEFGYDGTLLLIYSVESCGGGNNWSANAQVFAMKDGNFRLLGKPQTWSVVKGADFNYERALIYAVEQLPGDGHCCPTGGKTIEVTMHSGQPVYKQLKTWKASN